MMSFVQWTVLAVLLLLLAALVFTKIRPGRLFASAFLFTYMTGLVDLQHLIQPFANQSLITLLLLLLTGVAIEKTRFIYRLSRYFAKSSYLVCLLKMSLIGGLLSSVLNNTAVVASLISAVKNNGKHAPSRLLIPLSYAAILGGTLTLIGTSTNLIVNSFVEQAGLPLIGFFDFTLPGLVVFCGGLFVLAVTSQLLPSYTDKDREESSFYLTARIQPDSPMCSNTVEENGLRELGSLYLAEIVRADGGRVLPVSPETEIHPGDELHFAGDMDSVARLKTFTAKGLVIEQHSESPGNHWLEAIVSHSSMLRGRSLKEVRFRETYNAAVIAIRRGREQLSGGLGNIQIQAGDVLIIAPGKNFADRTDLKKEFVYLDGLAVQPPLNPGISSFVLMSFLGVIALSVCGYAPLLKGLMLLLAAYLLLGIVRLQELQKRFPLDLMLVVGSAIGLAQLMFNTGLAQKISSLVMYGVQDYGATGALIAVYLLTYGLTEAVTNNAAAAVAFPVAYSVATTLGTSPLPFIMTVAFAASASFLTPFGYQTNLMVFNAGRYSIKDFLRAGLPMAVVYALLVIVTIPIIFPF